MHRTNYKHHSFPGRHFLRKLTLNLLLLLHKPRKLTSSQDWNGLDIPDSLTDLQISSMHQTHLALLLHRAADRSATGAFHTVWPRLHYAVSAGTGSKCNCCFAGPKWRHCKWNSPFITEGYRALAALHWHFAGLCWVLNGFWVPFWALGILYNFQLSNTKFPWNVLKVKTGWR